MMFYKETNFKETPIGKIPKDWKVVKLGDEKVSELVKSGSTPLKKIKEYWNGDIPFVTIGDMTKVEHYLYETSEKITTKALKDTNLLLIPKNSILLSMYGTIGKVLINKIPVVVSQNIAAIIPTKDINEEYLLFALQKYSFQFRQTKIITLKHLDIKIVKNCLLPLPYSPEQQVIAQILLTIDEAIQKTNEIIAKTECLKKGLMQELLTKGIGHKEFKDTEIGRIPKEWKVEKLGNVAEFRNGINFTKEQKGDKGMLTIDVLNMYGESIYLNLENLYRVNISLEDMSEYLLKKGDILIVRSSLKREGVGWASLFNGWNEPVTFCGFIIRARLKNTTILPEFLTYFLRSDFSRNRLIASSGQVAITNVTQELLKFLRIPLPPFEEQQKIVEILSTVDKKLEIERNERAKLERIKQEMMDLLLTGKIRIKVS